jgi:hypothetical protein
VQRLGRSTTFLWVGDVSEALHPDRTEQTSPRCGQGWVALAAPSRQRVLFVQSKAAEVRVRCSTIDWGGVDKYIRHDIGERDPLVFRAISFLFYRKPQARVCKVDDKMTDVPFKALTGLAALSSYVLVGYLPVVLPFSHPSYLGTFAQVWIVSFVVYAFWKVILWPKFVSPLRHLPSPTGGSWWLGQFPRILAEPSGAPMREWQVSKPNARSTKC